MPEVLIPLGDRVLIRPVLAPSTTPGGLLLPESAVEKPHQGEVLAIPADKKHGFPIQVGDVVLYAKYAGLEVKQDGESMMLIKVADVVAKVSSTELQTALASVPTYPPAVKIKQREDVTGFAPPVDLTASLDGTTPITF